MQNNMTKLALLFGIVATMGLGTMNTAVADTSERTGVAIGHIELVLAGPDGAIKQYVQTDNVITHEGLDCLVDSLFIGTAGTGTCDTNVDPFDVVAIGVGTGQGVTDLTLATPLASGCIAGADPSVVADSGTGTQRITIEVVFGGATSTGADVTNAACQAAITEAGLFNTGDATTTANNMFAVQSFSVINIATADTLTVTWDLDFS